MLKALTKTVIETALGEEMSEHLGYVKHEVAGRNSGNSRNGVRTKTVLTDNVGPIEITVPTEQAAMKCLHMVTRSLDPKGTGQTRWTMRWKPALNAFAITFADRMPAPENL